MGKVKLVVQRRGRGSPTFRAPTHRSWGEIRLPQFKENLVKGKVIDIVHDTIHYAPLMIVEWENGELSLLPAALGIAVGDTVYYGSEAPNTIGSIKNLGTIPEGTKIYMIENNPGDGGKFVRASGTFAILTQKLGKKVIVQLPSGQFKVLDARAKAVIGVIAGGQRADKPFVKAGNKYYWASARNRYWPVVNGVKKNVADHPFGGKRHSKHGRHFTTSKWDPPGAKIGYIGARKTGRGK